jgi:hypothetical protein
MLLWLTFALRTRDYTLKALVEHQMNGFVGVGTALVVSFVILFEKEGINKNNRIICASGTSQVVPRVVMHVVSPRRSR